MRVRVVPDCVSPSGNVMRQGRRIANPSADQKECGFDTMAIEQIEQRRSDGGIRSIVKSERDRGCVARVPNGRSEQLRGRRHGSQSVCCARGKRPARDTKRRNFWDHIRIFALPVAKRY